MNCFELMRKVLEEEYTQISGSEAERDALVSGALLQLTNHYRNVSNNGPANYKDRVIRLAYLYCYTTAHANLVYQLVKGLQPLSNLFDRSAVEVSCVGCGPGSDYLGILKYIMLHGKRPKLRCNMFDREPGWMESWSEVDRKVETEFQHSLSFMAFDVTKPEQWQPHTKYYRSDLFTFVYFLSELIPHEKIATAYFATLMQQAKPDALFLFIDNNVYHQYSWFDRMAKANGLCVLNHGEGPIELPSRTDPGYEQPASLGRFANKFRQPDGTGIWFPKLRASAAYRLVRKSGGGY